MKLNRVYNRDCLEGMRELEADSIDAIVSDPPYQLSSMTKARPDQTPEGSYGRIVPFSAVVAKKGFMSKEWDILPTRDILAECLRVLKPGAWAMWCMTPRQDSYGIFLSRLSEAGFNISFTSIYWAYASGFPKAGNASKMADRKLGVKRERVPSKGSLHKGTGNTVGKYDSDGTEANEIPISDAAVDLNGSYLGFQPKPAIEIIVVSMKGLTEKSYIDQALKNRKGITWLDKCRIPYATTKDAQDVVRVVTSNQKGVGFGRGLYDPENEKTTIHEGVLFNPIGRFPANLLVSDNILDTGVNSKSAPFKSASSKGQQNVYQNAEFDYSGRGYADEGDFSRYFSLDAWFAEQVKELPKEQRRTFPFLVEPKADRGERNEGLSKMPDRYDVGAYGDGIGNVPKEKGQRPNPYKNIHPSVKPISLMSYLITLATRSREIILDPFMGSGTTAIAAHMTNRQFIGFEKEPEYHQIAEERIRHYLQQRKLMGVI